VIPPLRFLLLFVLAWSVAHAEPTVALLQPGEVFTYRVGWGLVGKAGEMKISAHAETTADNQPLIRVMTTTSSRVWCERFIRLMAKPGPSSTPKKDAC
jgi:hypothetical protein